MLTSDQAKSAVQLFGSAEKAASALGVSEGVIRRLVAGRSIPLEASAEIAINLKKLSKDELRAIEHGGALLNIMSPKQQRAIRTHGRSRGMHGDRWIEAVDEFRRKHRGLRIPDRVYGFIKRKYKRR